MRRSGGFFDIASKRQWLRELEASSQVNQFWNNSDEASKVLKNRSQTEKVVQTFGDLEKLAGNTKAGLELAIEANDADLLHEARLTFDSLQVELKRQEFFRMMSGKFDQSNAILEINAGAGGTEAQDWAQMLLRMYVRWSERKGFSLETVDLQAGEGAGIKSATILIQGEWSYGRLRSEQGVHRLVRISPFDANARRHTSFAAVNVTPELSDDIDVVIKDADLKMDTYRAGGAGGQYVNKTDSAVRLTHIPTGVIVASQSQRSQHKNRDMAMKLLKAKLYELQQEQLDKQVDELRGERRKIEFGSQIRSYVLHPYKLVKDVRTDFESSAAENVLDGDIDGFLESFLMQASDQSTSSKT